MTISSYVRRRAWPEYGWTARDFGGKDSVSVWLQPRHLAALDSLVDVTRTPDVPIWIRDRRIFRHPELGDAFAPVWGELRDGRGFAIIRGVPVASYDVAELKRLLWAIGTYFGAGQPQGGEVVDVVETASPLHSDICDMVALLAAGDATPGARTTGRNIAVASAHAIHALIEAERPDLLTRLYEGYFQHGRGRQAPGEDPVALHKVPVFSRVDHAVSLRYVRPAIEAALRARGETDRLLVAALDHLDATADRVKLAFALEPGDLLVLNNLTVLHAWGAEAVPPEPRRLLLRMRLDDPALRPQLPELAAPGLAASR